MLACLKEPKSDLGREWLEWLGPKFDPAECNLEKLNAALGKLRR
jgi:predicted aspartyl protease